MIDRTVKKGGRVSDATSCGDAAHQLKSSSQSQHLRQQSKDSSKDSRNQEENNNCDTFLKRYKVIEKIGEGSYSEVLKCQNRTDGSVVACKRLKHIYKSMDDVTNISEIATLRSIQKHSNILQMVEIHYDKTLGKVSLVFELMDINLYELIKDRKRLLPESRVRAIMFQLFRALRHLHKLGVFHRDIKPENILIKTKTDQLKLGDLGSVRGMFSRPPYTEYISTRWYRSPECLLTAGHYSHKMDIWAAGCVFYEVLTLRPLFPGSSEIDQINRINNVLGPPPIKLLETFQKQAVMERDTYRGQSQLTRRQQIQKVLDGYSSRYMIAADNSSKNSAKNYKRNNMEFHFAGKEGTGLEKILPAHITREAKDIIKTCLMYDPEQRSAANRIVQLPYFSELRESYAKNPDKTLSKVSVVLICDEVVTSQSTPIELGTLGDHKVRYRRGAASQKQKNTQPVKSIASGSKTSAIEKKSSSLKSTDINNNQLYTRRRCGSSRESSVVVAQARASLSRISGLVAAPSVSKVKTLERSGNPSTGAAQKSDKSLSGVGVVTKNSGVRTTNRASANSSNNGHGVIRDTSKVRVVRSKNSLVQVAPAPPQGVSCQQQRFSQQHVKQKSSSTSYDSIQSPEAAKERRREYSRQRDNRRRSVSRDPGVNALLNLPDISLSPYVKQPSELRFLRNKIKCDRGKMGGPPGIIQPTGSLQQQQNVEIKQQVQGGIGKVAVVPPKVAAAAIKYAKANARSKINQVTTDQTESSGTTIGSGQGAPRRRSTLSAADQANSYRTGSSVKLGKLRFRQAGQQQQQQQQQQRSKIPVLASEEPERVNQGLRRSTKIMSTTPEQRRESRGGGGATDKWRNTGIPRIVLPMSPEREKNLKILKESLTLDKDKRLQIKYQQERLAEQELRKNIAEKEAAVVAKKAHSSLAADRGRGRAGMKKMEGPPSTKSSYNYTRSGEAPQSTPSPGGVGGGRYMNSTTDYENPDAPETSSASAVALESRQRSLFNAATKKGQMIVPTLDQITRKPVGPPGKTSSDLYPQEMLDLYSSRFRGPDTTMNILKDSGNNYVKRLNAQEREQEVKEKLNHKLEMRRQRQLNQLPSVPRVGDQPSKILSEKSSYGHYPFVGGGEEVGYSPVAEGAKRSLPKFGGAGVVIGPGQGGRQRFGKDLTGGSLQFGQDRNRARQGSLIPVQSGFEQRNQRRSSSNVEPTTRKEGNGSLRKKMETRKAMRDDVFCSSDDDVVISMRKKFDSLISERARLLSETLKADSLPPVERSKHYHSTMTKGYDSNSDDNMRLISGGRRSRSRLGATEKSRKYARRELRARMAESLTMNGFSRWRDTDHFHEQRELDNRLLSNDSGEWTLPTPSYINKVGGRPMEDYNNNSIFSQSHLDIHTNNRREGSGLTYQNRIHPFPVAQQQSNRRGQIYTPPSSKPAYQQTGSMLLDRKLRYSHNNPMSLTTSGYTNNLVGKRTSGLEKFKKRQPI